MSDKVVQLHDRLEITLSPRATKIVREQIARFVGDEENRERSRDEWIEQRQREDRELRKMGIELTPIPQRLHERSRKRPTPTPEQIVDYALREIFYTSARHLTRNLSPGRCAPFTLKWLKMMVERQKMHTQPELCARGSA